MVCVKWNDCRAGWHVRLHVWKYGVMHTWERSNPTFPTAIKDPELIVITQVTASAV